MCSSAQGGASHLHGAQHTQRHAGPRVWHKEQAHAIRRHIEHTQPRCREWPVQSSACFLFSPCQKGFESFPTCAIRLCTFCHALWVSSTIAFSRSSSPVSVTVDDARGTREALVAEHALWTNRGPASRVGPARGEAETGRCPSAMSKGFVCAARTIAGANACSRSEDTAF
jgi:hypothetical protein